MADRYYSGASGLWSTLANWDNYQSLSYPTPLDDVYANNRTVTINQDINVLSIRTTTTPQTSTAGGRFQVLTNGYTLTTDIIAGTTEGLYVNLSANTNTLNIIGNITGGTSNAAHGLLNVSAGTINITASKGLIQTGNTAHLFSNTGRGTINSTATTMTTSRLANGYGSYINNTGGGTINLYATEIGAGTGDSAHAIINSNGNVTVSAITFSSGTGTNATCLNSVQATSSISANTNMYGTNFLHWSGATTFIVMNASGVVNAIADVTDRIPSVPIGSATPTLFGFNSNVWVRVNAAITFNGTATTVNFAGSNIANTNGDADLSTSSRTGAFQFNGNNNCFLNISADSFSFNTSVSAGYFIQSNSTTANFNTGTINIVGRNTDKVSVYYVNPNILLNGASRTNPSFITLGNGCSLNAKLTDVMSVPPLTGGSGTAYGLRVTDGTANIICDNVIGASGSAANHTVLLNGSGIINITGSSYILDSGGVGTGAYLVANTGSGVINVSGNTNAKVYRTETTPNTYGLLSNASTGNINFITLGDGSLTGSVITNPYGNATSTISNTSTGNINITADTFYVNSAVTTSNVYPIYNAGSVTVSNPTINAYFNKTYLIPSPTLTTGTDMIRLGGSGAYGTINFTGTDIAGNNSSAGVNNFAANGIININCANISAGTVAAAYGIHNNASGVINVTANTIQSTISQGIRNTLAGTINVKSERFLCDGSANFINNVAGGTINASATTFSFTNNGSGYIINNAGVGTINVTGNTISSGTNPLTYGTYNASSGRINMYFNEITPPSSYTNYTIFNGSTGRIDINTTTISASSLLNTYSIYSTTAGIINVTADTISSSNNTPAIYSTNATATNNIVYGNLIFTNGVSPVYFVPNATSKLVANTSSNTYLSILGTDNNYKTFASSGFTGLNPFVLPVSGNVRSNIIYGYSASTTSFTGTSIVPLASAVTYGTLFDNTTGTSIISVYDFGNSLTKSGQTV
jgi:autotransporter family porin